MKCSHCGGHYEEVTEARVIHFPKRSATVDATFLRCSGCGDVVWTPAQVEGARLCASVKIRQKEGLLLPADIRHIREDLGLTQRAFERLLRVGTKTVVRWEGGTVFQSTAVDNILRAIRDMPGLAQHLAKQNGVRLPAPALRASPAPSHELAPRIHRPRADVLRASPPAPPLVRAG